MAEAWHIVATITATVILLGAVGGVVLLVIRFNQSSRIERQAVANGQEVAATMRDIGHALHDICERMTSGNQANRETREDLRQMIKDVSQLVLDVERRLGCEIKENREWMALQFGKSSGVGVHINGGQNNVGQTDIHGNQRQSQ